MFGRRNSGMAIGALAAVGLLVSGCSSSGTADSSSTSGGKKTIAFVTPQNTNPYYGTMKCGAQDAAKKNDVNLLWQGTASTETADEMNVLNSVMAKKPDGMSMTVWDNTAFNAVAHQYMAGGAPLVTADSLLSDNSMLQSIRTDSFGSSRDAAKDLTKNITGGSVLILTDKPGNQIQMARANGFKEGLKSNGSLKTLDIQYVGSDSAKASSTVSSALAANPGIKLVFTTNDAAGTGASNALRAAKQTGKTTLVGYDTEPAQVDQLRKGEYQALIAQSPYQMGYDAVSLLADVLSGKTKKSDVTEKTKYTPWYIVTKANVDTAKAQSFVYKNQCN